MIKNFPGVDIKPIRIIICGLIIGLMMGCNFDKPKIESKSKVIAGAVPQGKPDTTIKFLARPAFPGTTRAACCKGLPSRAKALATKRTK